MNEGKHKKLLCVATFFQQIKIKNRSLLSQEYPTADMKPPLIPSPYTEGQSEREGYSVSDEV